MKIYTKFQRLISDSYYSVKLIRDRYRYPKCKRAYSHEAFINSVEDQLRPGIRLKDIAQNTGLHEHTIKDNDLYV